MFPDSACSSGFQATVNLLRTVTRGMYALFAGSQATVGVRFDTADGFVQTEWKSGLTFIAATFYEIIA